MSLTIKIYKNVPLDKNYNDVLYFSQPANFETWLNTYIDDTKTNIPQYFDGKNEIILNNYYEDANYMLIYDTNSQSRPYKFYFIDRPEFINAGNIKYHLTLDVWHTYQYSITLKSSLLVKGHIDTILNSPKIWTDAKPVTTYKKANIENFCNNMLISPYTIGTITIIATISTSYMTYTAFGILNDVSEVNAFMANLQNLHLYGGLTTTFEIENLYIIPNFDLKEKYDDMIPYYATVDTYPYFDNVYLTQTSSHSAADTIFLVRDFFMYHYTEGEETINETKYINFIQEFTISSKNAFKNNNISRLYNRYFVGALNNCQEISNVLNDNETMTLNLCINFNKQIEFIFRYSNIQINLTNSFEIPFKNDNYSLYMNRNRAQIEAQNTSNATQLLASIGMAGLGVALSPATAGLSTGLIAGAIGGGLSFANSAIKENAKIKDAKNQITRNDNLNNGAIIMLLYGIGCFEYVPNDTNSQNDEINKFGFECNDYVSTYKYQGQQPNYAYLQYQDVRLYGDCNYNIIEQFKTIFNRGVRIWYNTAQFMEDINYK